MGLIRLLRVSLLACVLVYIHTPAWAETETEIFALVSEHSAAEFTAGVSLLHEQSPGVKITARTPVQLEAVDDAILRGWLERADIVLMIGVFGPMVERIVPLLQNATAGEILAFSSDYRLIMFSRDHSGRRYFENKEQVLALAKQYPDAQIADWWHAVSQEHSQQLRWIKARSFWQARGVNNITGLLQWLTGAAAQSVLPVVQQPLRLFQHEHQVDEVVLSHPAMVAIIDHARGDRAGDRDLSARLCRGLEQADLDCVVLLAEWGQASVEAVDWIAAQAQQRSLAALIDLQDFVIGGGDGREQVTARLTSLNAPVFKGIRLGNRAAAEWRLSADGISWDKVHYQVAMPELQGVSQPIVLAAMDEAQIDPVSGIRFAFSRPLEQQVRAIVARIGKWHVLQKKSNRDKRVAIVYYNHPPGRHNIGADNLDVPATLWEILTRLATEGYRVDGLPDSPEGLLDMLQHSGVNLPNDSQALAQMASRVATLSAGEYQQYFTELPVAIRRELEQGPLGYLHANLVQMLALEKSELAENLLTHTSEDLLHVLEGIEHPARERALDLLSQLVRTYRECLSGEDRWDWAEKLLKGLVATGIEGLRGWGPAPGRVMVHDNQLLLPGLRFGNIFVGPQPPRGWEIDEELLHANLTFPPPHQYLAFYHYLRDIFRADALVHVGRHSTYEFLPRRRVGLTPEDYPTLIAGNLPGIYPYIVDGVGEGIQAKRRGLAVMVDHLTPPLSTTPLYDELLQLRQLVESFESSESQGNVAAQQRSIMEIRQLLDKLNLTDELSDSMVKELSVRGITFDQVDDELLVHEVGHYLTKLQEAFMPLGLHVFGRDWDKQAVAMMLDSMTDDPDKQTQLRPTLTESPKAEMTSLLNALAGGFVRPGKGNDPIRTPEALPTGRNFHALDGSLLPTRIGYATGKVLAQKARADNPMSPEKKEAVILWASDTVRDEGAMIAFGMDMLGVTPVWNSRGIVEGIELLDISTEPERVRRDVVFTTSGLFRDLYGEQLVWLDRAVLLALDASSHLIREQYPALSLALTTALAPLEKFSRPGSEPLERNQVAMHWVEETRRLLQNGTSAEQAGSLATLRLFGTAPGAYGAGINRLAERSAAWQDRAELGRAYINRMGHAYGIDKQGVASHKTFINNLRAVENTYLGRASNLYGLMDNNDAFDYLGGLSLAVETVTGQAPENFVVQHSNPQRAGVAPLEQVLLQELRGQFLNPAWLTPLMEHGYAGARTMGSEFLEYLWGWQITNPAIVDDWVWEEVKAVYIDDRYQINLDKFLEQGHNVHVKANMLAIMLVAVQKGFWQADEKTVAELANRLAQLLVENGLPGSGHTRPDHPMFDWLLPQLPESLRAQLAATLTQAQGDASTAAQTVTTTIAELQVEDAAADFQANETAIQRYITYGLLAVVFLLFLAGLRAGVNSNRQRS